MVSSSSWRGWKIVVIMVVIIGFITGLTAEFWRRIHRANAQWQSVRVIQRHGGWVFYNCEYNEDGSLRSARPKGPLWARRLFGPDFFDTPHGVYLGPCPSVEGLPDFGMIDQGIPVTDEVLVAVGKLEELQWLVLCKTKITDQGLRHLASLRHLRWLWLNDTSITDAGLSHLATLIDLEKIWLDGTRIQGPGLRSLQNLRNLRWLSLRNTLLDDTSLQFLAPLTQLERLSLQGSRCSFAALLELLCEHQGRKLEDALFVAQYARRNSRGEIVSLDLSQSQVRDEDLVVVAKLPALEWLILKGNPVTDQGLSHIAPLMKLSLLDLSDTRITDPALELLSTFPRLADLHLEGTNVTAEGVAQLQKKVSPRLRIYFRRETDSPSSSSQTSAE